MEWYHTAIYAFSGLLFLLLLGIPVSFSLLMVALVALFWMGKGVVLLGNLPGLFFGMINSFVMTCVPLFIFMATIIDESGFTRRMFDAVRAWLGRVPGSVCMVGVVACSIFAAVNGSSAGTAAAVGTIALPEYRRAGCDTKLSVGAIAAGGSLGILIPPSMAMIFYCLITEESIGALFSAGILPGLMTTFIFLIYIFIRCQLNPNLIPKSPNVSWRERWQSTKGLIPIGIVILFVLGSIYAGIATPTEAAGLGCFISIVLGFALKGLSLSGLKRAVLVSVRVNGFLILIVLGAISFGAVLERARVTTGFAEFIVGLGLSKWTVLVVINFLYLFLGCFMDPTPIILTTMPTLFPVSQALGFNPIWFGVMTVMNLELAAITPPVGFNLFVLRGIGRDYLTTGEIIVGAIPFGILYVFALAIVIIFPQVALFLPGLMMGR